MPTLTPTRQDTAGSRTTEHLEHDAWELLRVAHSAEAVYDATGDERARLAMAWLQEEAERLLMRAAASSCESPRCHFKHLGRSCKQE